MQMTLTDASELANRDYQAILAGRVYLAEQDQTLLVCQDDDHAVLIELEKA